MSNTPERRAPTIPNPRNTYEKHEIGPTAPKNTVKVRSRQKPEMAKATMWTTNA
jgi:hypothetical protein